MTEQEYQQERDALLTDLEQAKSNRYFSFVKIFQINRELERLEREVKKDD